MYNRPGPSSTNDVRRHEITHLEVVVGLRMTSVSENAAISSSADGKHDGVYECSASGGSEGGGGDDGDLTTTFWVNVGTRHKSHVPRLGERGGGGGGGGGLRPEYLIGYHRRAAKWGFRYRVDAHARAPSEVGNGCVHRNGCRHPRDPSLS